MKAVIIGNGSIGKRHKRNLKEMGIDVRTVDVDEAHNLNAILNSRVWDFGLVCSPTNLHLQHTYELVRRGIPTFCEKPFYREKDKELLTKIRRCVKHKNLPNMVGCNLRFHEEIAQVANHGFFKKPDVAYAHFGYDLKKWHNDGKHLELYSANKSMGGGITFDAIHEFDYLYHWYGEIDKIDVVAKKVSDVTVDTEDVCDGKIYFRNGQVAYIHLDYLAPEYTRFFMFPYSPSCYYYDKPINIVPSNEMYEFEMRYFVGNLIYDVEGCINSFDEAIHLIDKINEGLKYEF